MEDHPACGDLGLQQLLKVPGNGFSLPVLIGCEQELLAFFQLLLQIGDEGILALGYHILRPEIMLDIDAEAVGRKVPDMALAGYDGEVPGKIFFDGICFCG